MTTTRLRYDEAGVYGKMEAETVLAACVVWAESAVVRRV